MENRHEITLEDGQVFEFCSLAEHGAKDPWSGLTLTYGGIRYNYRLKVQEPPMETTTTMRLYETPVGPVAKIFSEWGPEWAGKRVRITEISDVKEAPTLRPVDSPEKSALQMALEQRDYWRLANRAAPEKIAEHSARIATLEAELAKSVRFGEDRQMVTVLEPDGQKTFATDPRDKRPRWSRMEFEPLYPNTAFVKDAQRRAYEKGRELVARLRANDKL